ncbi:biopolymer transporter ExbD [Dechloromonas sp. HYN0024]|uniref:ExbD/TolR family protein n=1 Tax=Dechloromonas sp. HYN0024 TaxID=2231055 RepID=UPI000E45332F|nr:biopolymer transporter ExbD [Dechloromonas sp. HYN0024]AXS80130.1 biopolymer transporter ExbD [Dechloromonas sp. HYN0024]
MHVQTETKPYDSINVTPMLDLAYVLLVIFIIMTTASVQGLNINLPKPSNKPSTVKKEMRIVQVMPGGRLLLNGAGVSMPQLESLLTALHSRDPEFSLVVKGDPEADYANVVEIIDLAGRLNISNLGLVTARIGT